MSLYTLSPELDLLTEQSDRRFRRFMTFIGLPALILAVIIPMIHLPERLVEQVLPPRYAQLIQQITPPAPAKEEPKPEEEKKEPDKPKAAEKPKPKPEPTQEQKVAKAREKASKLMSFADDLADLRDANAPRVDTLRTVDSNVLMAPNSEGGRSSLQSAAIGTSGGIGETGAVQRGASGTGLGNRNTTQVQSPVGTGRDAQNPNRAADQAGRSLEDINIVFDRNKSAFYALYNRALRENPSLRGKVVLSISIAPSGAVTDCHIVASELHNSELESKIVARVLLLNFGAKNVPPITMSSYPLTFFPI